MTRTKKPAKHRIRMRTTAAGPNGVLEAGKEYKLPVDKAYPLVVGGYAEDLEPYPESVVAVVEKKKALISDREWLRGIEPSDWAARHHPEIFETLKENSNWGIHVLGGNDDPVKNSRYFAALESLHSNLMADVEARRIVLKIPPLHPTENAKVVSDDAIIEVVKGLLFHGSRASQSNFNKTWVEIRIFRGDKMSKDDDLDSSEPPTLFSRILLDLEQREMTEAYFRRHRGRMTKYAKARSKEWGNPHGSINTTLRTVLSHLRGEDTH